MDREHHFSEDEFLSSVLPFAGALVQATSSINIGVGIALAPFYDPIRLAEDTATLDVLSRGRFHLGLGAGYRTEEFRGFAVPKEGRHARMVELTEILNRALSQKRFSFDGEFYQYDDLRVTPSPYTTPRPAIYYGGVAEAAVERAGEHSEGWIASQLHPK